MISRKKDLKEEPIGLLKLENILLTGNNLQRIRFDRILGLLALFEGIALFIYSIYLNQLGYGLLAFLLFLYVALRYAKRT